MALPPLSLIETGHFALLLAWLNALMGVALPLVFYRTKNCLLVPAAVVRSNFILITVSFLTLVYAFVTSDFSVALVVANSHSLKPLLFKVAGAWGNHEGSLLLWILILSLYGFIFTFTKNGNISENFKQGTCFVQNGLMFLFLGLSLFTSNPFQRVFPPAFEGNDLNPLLQDVALAFHPPLLYVGYVGYSLVFALAIAGLWQRRIDRSWARLLRPWALTAWVFLTAGLTLGSWWAYYELGWGGWWFWDPVENAALLPWLTGTALFHSLIVLERREHLPNWTVLLAIICFSLSLLGTFLVRSGVITSVHAFASDPTRGLFILGMLAFIICGSLLLYALRRPATFNDDELPLISRETALIINNLFLIAGMVTVLVGTLYPYILDTLTGTLISVGPPYFALTFVPLMLPLMALMAIGPFMIWGQTPLIILWKRIRLFTLATIFIVLLILQNKNHVSIMSVAGLIAGVWIITSSLTYWWERAQHRPSQLLRQPLNVWGIVLGHLGLGVAILGMVGSVYWTTEQSAWLRPGSQMQIGPYTAQFDGVQSGIGDNFNRDTATLQITQDKKAVTTLKPEKRWYPVAGKDTTEVAISLRGTGDLYASLGTESDQEAGKWLIKLYLHPMITLLWAGAALTIAGGLCALWHTKRYSRIQD